MAWLARGLLELGHSVTLVAREGSQVPGATWIPYPESSPGDFSTELEKLLPTCVQVLHLSSTPAQIPKRPFIVTIHGNGKPGETFHPNTVFVSRSHAALHGSLRFVYNGIDINEYACLDEREDTLVFLAKASWKVKNLQGAIEIARECRRPLQVLGSRSWPLGIHRLLPAWKGVKYHGMVGDLEKRDILKKAGGLLFPVRWPEPFGIALTEALASGCPVFGTPYGSLPEIVSPEVGSLSDSAQDLVQAIQSRQFVPAICRTRVATHFTHRQMAQNYVKIYEELLQTGTLATLSPHETAPLSTFKRSSETLLPWKSIRD